jgi:hypothetical protein
MDRLAKFAYSLILMPVVLLLAPVMCLVWIVACMIALCMPFIALIEPDQIEISNGALKWARKDHDGEEEG